MSRITRRLFVAQSAALLPASRLLAWEPLTSKNLGVQLYTVRNIIKNDPQAVLKKIDEIGYTEVEAIYSDLDMIWTAVKQTSLKPVSVHVDAGLFFEGGSKLKDALAKCKEHGFKYAVMPYIAPAQRGGADMFKSLAEKLNAAGETAKDLGLQLCYHNHAFEFKKLGDTTGLEILMDRTHKGLVSLEMDIFWVTVAGNNPVDLLGKYSGRVLLLHVKNKAASFTKTQFSEDVPKDAFTDAKSGTIDLSAVLRAADTAGVQDYFVEQDQTPGDPLVSLQTSFDFLKTKFSS